MLMNYQWQTLWCQVEAGVLNLFSDESSEVMPQYTVQLRGSEIRPDNTQPHTHRITILQHGDPLAVLEVHTRMLFPNKYSSKNESIYA